jgi:putative ABC transport system substrate-binding protein
VLTTATHLTSTLEPPHHPGMDRRRFLLTSLAGALTEPLGAQAQPSARIGYLGQNSPSAPSMPALLRSFREGLGSLGYLEGQNLAIEYRWAEGVPERLGKLAAELAGLSPDAIVCTGPAGIRATKSATSAISIVAIDFETDPVRSGAIASLSRPGGNLTGIFLDQADLGGKWLQLLREAVPRLSRAAVVWDVANPSPQFEAVEVGAKTMGIEL